MKQFAITALTILLGFSSSVMAGYEYQGIKFYVPANPNEETVRLYRLVRPDRSHIYTIDKKEVIDAIEQEKAQLDTFLAYVYTKPKAGTNRLFRITVPFGKLPHYFYTAFEPEKNEVLKDNNKSLHPMVSYVFPHDFKATGSEFKNVLPVFAFYDKELGNHLYTTSVHERDALIENKGGTPPPSGLLLEKPRKDAGNLSPAEKLAVLETNNSVPLDPKIVDRFDAILKSLNKAFPDQSEFIIAATIFKSFDIVKENTPNISLLNLAENIEYAVPRNQSKKNHCKFADVVAIFTGLIISGQYDDLKSAATDARATIEELIRYAEQQ
ncbi:hypothetical protein [Rubinisphaera italica]|uniref:DUF5648 domain-containing protein n=1 Tax=Rubinisphaera italica TaxID=2527969 RepID=A0A5C5XIK4_9PLAN|nr:hypothetical protein [Rubinisphaera italica]TWT62840.1 hypothetical protein Pan54_35860 [Rubinisphaera italica]